MRQAGSHLHSRKETDDPALRERCTPHTEPVLLDDVITPGPEADQASGAQQSQHGLFRWVTTACSSTNKKRWGQAFSMEACRSTCFEHFPMRLMLYYMGIMVSSIYVSKQMQEAGSREQKAGSREHESRKPAEVSPTGHDHDVVTLFPYSTAKSRSNTYY